MRRFATGLLFLAALAVSSSPALAQRYLSPYAGYAHGEAAGNCPSFWDDCPERRTGYGVVFGSLGGGVMGFEQDISWTPDFFGEDPELESSSVLTIMSNLVLGLPIGPLRPYGSVGLGLLKANAKFTAENLTDFGDTSFGYNYGAGVMVILPAHLGIRLDFRRFRSGGDLPLINIGTDARDLRFSRATIGLVLH